MLLCTILLAGLSATLILAGPAISSSPKTVHEKRSAALSAHWSKHKRLDERDVVHLRIGLTQQNTHRVADILYSVSDPKSPDYGKHWSSQQIADFFAPHEETILGVKNWLQEEGFEDDRYRLTNSKGWIELKVSATEAERLLDTQFHEYRHTDGSRHVGEYFPYIQF